MSKMIQQLRILEAVKWLVEKNNNNNKKTFL